MRIQARQCPFTRKIFLEEDRDRYIQHLSDLRASMREKRTQNRAAVEWDRWLSKEKEKICDIEDLAPWIIKNLTHIGRAYNVIKHPRDGDKIYHSDKITNLTIRATYNPRCSNTHCCPRGGVTNWWCKDDLPRGYPGFSGRISGTLERSRYKSNYPVSDLLEFVDIHTGSGGGGNNNWAYDVTVFEVDWPNITQKITMDILKNA